MNILCDTCSILMVIKIAPEMFTNEEYQCVTIREVRDEIFQTQKFKDKYPWRIDFRNKVTITPLNPEKLSELTRYENTIRILTENLVINENTGKIIDLSPTDRTLISFALAHGFDIASEDSGIIAFCNQQFTQKCISSIGLVNKWIKQGHIVWDSQYQSLIQEWKSNNEASQPVEDIEEFEKLTGYTYEGY